MDILAATARYGKPSIRRSLWERLQQLEASARLHSIALDFYLIFSPFSWHARYVTAPGALLLLFGPFGFTYRNRAAEKRFWERSIQYAKINQAKSASQGLIENKQAEDAGENAPAKDGRGHSLN